MLEELGPSYDGGLSSSDGASAGYRGQIGARSAWAHAVAHNLEFRESDVLVSETSAPVWGYNAELERAMIIGPPTGEMQRLFDHMVAAQQVAFAALRPGVTCADVDRAVLGYFEETAILPTWSQHTGHAIGLRNHEAPFLDLGDHTPIEAGMVFTVGAGVCTSRAWAASATPTRSSSHPTESTSSPTIRAISRASRSPSEGGREARYTLAHASPRKLASDRSASERLSRRFRNRRPGKRRDRTRTSLRPSTGAAPRAPSPHDRKEEAMPMPHRTFAEVAKRRLVGKEGSERVATIRALMEELPGYRNGPYADLRKWLEGGSSGRACAERSCTATRSRYGAKAPRSSRSSARRTSASPRCCRRCRDPDQTGDSAFTTLRPGAALTRIGGVLVQLVEIPGLIEGASDDRGGGRALLGVLRSVDGIVFCRRRPTRPPKLRSCAPRSRPPGIEKPAFLALTSGPREDGDRRRLPSSVHDLEVVALSILDDRYDRLRDAIWRLTGLIRVYPRRAGVVDSRSRSPPVRRSRTSPIASITTSAGRAPERSCGGRPPASTVSVSGATTSSRTETSSRCTR